MSTSSEYPDTDHPDMEIVVPRRNTPYKILRAIEKVAEMYDHWPNVRDDWNEYDNDRNLLIGMDIIDLSEQKEMFEKRDIVESIIAVIHKSPKNLKRDEKNLQRVLTNETRAVRAHGADVEFQATETEPVPEPPAPEPEQLSDLAVQHCAEGRLTDFSITQVTAYLDRQPYAVDSKDLRALIEAVLAAKPYLRNIPYELRPLAGIGTRRVISSEYLMLIAHWIADQIGQQGVLALFENN